MHIPLFAIALRSKMIQALLLSCFSSVLQGVSIVCYAERLLAIINPSVRLSVCLSVTRWHCVNMTHATIMGSSLEDSLMTLVSLWLTSARNSKGNIGNGRPNDKGVGKIGNF